MHHRHHRRLVTVFSIVALAACSGGGKKTPGGGGNGGPDSGGTGDGGAGGNPAGGNPAGGNPAGGNPAGGDDAATADCLDGDKDGFGKRCKNGPDCDDVNPAIGGYEVCDGKDNDCDDKQDEVLKDVCTACSPEANCAPVPSPDNVSGWVPPDQKDPEDVKDVIVDGEGALTLSRDEAQAHAIWVANTDDLVDDAEYTNDELPRQVRGTVSKIDSATNKELARYVVVLPSATLLVSELGSSTPKPSRTAVNQNFDAFVANRAYDNATSVGTVTKYANDEKDCIDRNTNGKIETSRDIDMDGHISLLKADGEFLGLADECILWTVKTGDQGDWPRALAVGVAAQTPDSNGEVGDVYVGLHGEKDARGQQVLRLNPATGAILATIETPGFRPYGCASDAKGRVWCVSRGSTNRLGFVENDIWTPIPKFSETKCALDDDRTPNAYGVSTDGDNRVYVAITNCIREVALVYDHDNGETTLPLNAPDGEGGTARGVAVSKDHVWVALSGSGNETFDGNGATFLQFDRATRGHLKTHQMPHGREPIGIGVSFDDSIWAINRKHDGTFAGGLGVATRLNLAVPDGDPNQWIELEVGRDPYTYSDFIGYGLNTFANPRGFYRYVLEGCPGEITHWRAVEVHAKLPSMTGVTVRVRSGNTSAELEAAAWSAPQSATDPSTPLPLVDVPDGALLEVEVTLSTDDQSKAPQVFGVDVIRECESSLM